MEKILFSADLHGNIGQYRKILDHARESNVDVVIFGGDLTPKDPELRTPLLQKKFLEEELFPLFAEFRKQSDIHVLTIMGNDDFKSNHEVMVSGQDLYGYRMIDQVPYISQSGYTIVGYSHVPFTPFKYKCWERRDRDEDNDFSHRDDTRIEGVISQNDVLVPYDLRGAFNKPSIEEDLSKLTSGLNMDNLILVSHAPPHGTVCDFNREQKHVGSRAVREFVEREQPYATLHGHIHETVDLKGNHVENLGRTFCVAVGNDHRPDAPYVIEGTLGAQPVFKRRKLG